MNRRRNALIGLIVLFMGLLITVHALQKTTPVTNNEITHTRLPSPTDIQLLLNELEPNEPLHVDGIIGKATIEKWERVYCNESARIYFEE